MKKTFYFIRHGQTDLNLRGIVQGRGVNTPLNDNGRKQAQSFFEAYKDVPFDKIYTSTLLRTQQTVESFVKKGIPCQELIGLDEISWGIYEGREQDEEVMTGFDRLVKAWRNNQLDIAVEKGETPNQLVARQKEAIAYILQQADESTVLVCMHGRALRILLCHLTDVPVCQMDDFPHTNTALYVLEYEHGQFSIVDHYNTQHLDNPMNRKIRVSAVNYTNTLPFLRGIKSSNLSEQIELTSDVPAACASKLIKDEADLGIVPVQAILDIPNAEIIGDYCIGSDGAVDSVFIFSKKPICEIQTLRLDPQSRTSNGLARILLKNFWKREVTLVGEGEADATVLIGDRTFGKKKEYAYSYDLGHYWKEFTGLPFAYAAWVSNKPLPEEFIEKFNEALGNGVADPEAVIPGLPEIEGFDYRYYLTKNLDFHLTAEKRQAIVRYHELFLQLDEVVTAG